MEHLFSYGTLQQQNVQLETFARILNGNKDVLCGYVIGEVLIQDAAVVKTSGKAIHPILQYTGRDNDEVEGTVFEISKQELQQADDYEVEQYKRVAATLKSGQTAWIYADANAG